MLQNTMEAEAPLLAPGIARIASELYTPVEILSNHHKRLLYLVEDFGPTFDARYVFPNYLFLNTRPPSWFWGVTGVVRRLREQVSGCELDRVAVAYESLSKRDMKPVTAPAYLESAVIEVRSVDGRVVASINMFGRRLQARVG